MRHSGRREATIRNPEKTIVYWIPDLDFVSSGMTFGAVPRLFQQPARSFPGLSDSLFRWISK